MICLGACLGAALVVAQAWPRSSDGLDHLRKYNPREYRSQSPLGDLSKNREPLSFDKGRSWFRVFRFPPNSPALTELRAQSCNPRLDGEVQVIMPNGRVGRFIPGQQMLVLFDDPPPDWLETQWLSLSQRLNH